MAKKIIVDRDNMTSEERQKAIEGITAASESTEKPEIEVKSEPVISTEKEEKTGLTQKFELEYVDKDHPKKDDTPPPPSDKEPKQTDAEKAQAEAAEKKNALWSDMTTLNPELKEKYKSYDEFLTATKAPAPPAADDKPQKLMSDDERARLLVDKTYEMLGEDADVADLLSIAELKTVPVTQKEWLKLAEDNPQVHKLLVNKFNTMKAQIDDNLKKVETTYASKPKDDEAAATTFATRVEKLVKDARPNIDTASAKEVTAKMEAWFEKNMNNNKYHVLENGIPKLSADLLYAGFLSEENVLDGIPLTTNGNGKEKINLKEEARKQAAQNGVSQKTLSNSGINTGANKVLDFSNPNTRDNLGSTERQRLLKYLTEESRK
jgi:hypothetical protein